MVCWNLKAAEADLRVAERQGRVNYYTAYRINNYRFAIYGAMFLGQYEPAITAAEEILRQMPEQLLRIESPNMADDMESNLSMKTHAQDRFGRWHDIIAGSLPDDQTLWSHTTAILHYGKVVAHAAFGNVAEAALVRQKFMTARARVPETPYQHNNRCADLLAVAERMLDGEIEYRKEKHDVLLWHFQ